MNLAKNLRKFFRRRFRVFYIAFLPQRPGNPGVNDYFFFFKVEFEAPFLLGGCANDQLFMVNFYIFVRYPAIYCHNINYYFLSMPFEKEIKKPLRRRFNTNRPDRRNYCYVS
jgi:hypothetical protein